MATGRRLARGRPGWVPSQPGGVGGVRKRGLRVSALLCRPEPRVRHGLPGWVWASRKPTWVTDVATDERFVREELAARLGVRSTICVPFVSGNTNYRVVQLFSSNETPLDESLLETVTTLGLELGQFLERTRAEEEIAAEVELAEPEAGSGAEQPLVWWPRTTRSTSCWPCACSSGAATAWAWTPAPWTRASNAGRRRPTTPRRSPLSTVPRSSACATTSAPRICSLGCSTYFARRRPSTSRSSGWQFRTAMRRRPQRLPTPSRAAPRRWRRRTWRPVSDPGGGRPQGSLDTAPALVTNIEVAFGEARDALAAELAEAR